MQLSKREKIFLFTYPFVHVGILVVAIFMMLTVWVDIDHPRPTDPHDAQIAALSATLMRVVGFPFSLIPPRFVPPFGSWVGTYLSGMMVAAIVLRVRRAFVRRKYSNATPCGVARAYDPACAGGSRLSTLR